MSNVLSNALQWKLEGRTAQILNSCLEGVCDLSDPFSGVRVQRIAGHAITEMHVLGADLRAAPVIPTTAADESCDAYLRCGDLVANYLPTAARPFRSQAYWRLNSHELATPAGSALAAIELVASKQTDLLDSRPDLLVQSRFAAIAAWRLKSGDGEFQPMDLGRGQDYSLEILPDTGTSCCVYRLAGDDLSYAEMVYPLDFERSTIRFLANSEQIYLEHRLFGHRLEKGVILRSRVLGLFLPRSNDLQLAAEHYAMFSASDPPLTT